ncbi:MAG: YIP1 family protein [candidate division Zixibacteria bacterium]|nr:YIP1 family protein [candidate division Zixibacteria bacterium]MBU1470097.1 YIP1 family protein [candidate division Zixibacteria bacterium]MBU2624417.1 YIP1 family protein [candidate division Zixibacteria bacterium]
MSNEALVRETGTEMVRRPSTWSDVVNLFVSPRSTFESVSRRARWVIPFLLLVLCAVVFEVSVSGTRMDDLKLQVKNDPDMSQDDIQHRLDNIENQRSPELVSLRTGLGVLALGVLEFAKLLGLSIVLLLFCMLFVSELRFVAILSICAFSSLILIPEIALKIPLILLKGTTHIWFSPAALFSGMDENNLMFRFMQSIDIFTIWKMILVGMGLHTVFGIAKSKSYLIVTVLFLLWVAGHSLLGGLIHIA